MSELQAADAYCRLLAGGHYENFVVASGVLRRDARLHLMRIYAFCRTTDDLGDESGSSAIERLERWRDEVAALFAGEAPVHPVLIALRETMQRYTMPAQPFLDLIEANVQDQRVSTYATWAELEAYCMLSAAPVGRMVLRVFGMTGPLAERFSDDVCIGLQLANHAQDVSRDAKIGRTYLLQSELQSDGITGAVHGLVERARGLLASGRALEAMAPQPLRLQLALYRLGGLAICDEIEAAGYRTDLRRPHVSNAKKVALLARGIVESMRPREEVRDAKTV
ncbi:MAG: squalene/phytoene synthase family protein [Vulcanimicrobiaceae bacterium]